MYSPSHECGLMLFGADEAEDGNTFYIRELGKVDCNIQITLKLFIFISRICLKLVLKLYLKLKKVDFVRNVKELTTHDLPKMVGGDSI